MAVHKTDVSRTVILGVHYNSPVLKVPFVTSMRKFWLQQVATEGCGSPLRFTWID
jgi:hypothetical protein